MQLLVVVLGVWPSRYNPSGSFDRQMDSNRLVQQSAGGCYPVYSGYVQPSYIFAGTKANTGYEGYGIYGVGGYGSGSAGYGGPAGAYLSGAKSGYLGGNPSYTDRTLYPHSFLLASISKDNISAPNHTFKFWWYFSKGLILSYILKAKRLSKSATAAYMVG